MESVRLFGEPRKKLSITQSWRTTKPQLFQARWHLFLFLVSVFFSVYNLFLNNVGGFDNQPLFFPTPTRIRETLDDAGLSLGWLPRSTLVQNYGEVKFRFQIWKFINEILLDNLSNGLKFLIWPIWVATTPKCEFSKLRTIYVFEMERLLRKVLPSCFRLTKPLWWLRRQTQPRSSNSLGFTSALPSTQ